MLDFDAMRSGQVTIFDLTQGLTLADLKALTNESLDTILHIIEDAVDADVVLVPDDPTANDTFASDPSDVNLAWTLGHVIVHSMASGEEAAFLAAELARGVPLHGRSRYEVPWQQILTIAQCRERVAESRRIRLASLDMWPDQPHLEVTYELPPRYNSAQANAIVRFAFGLSHEQSHYAQLTEIARQAKQARHELSHS
jgi:hypothetical protein